MHDFLLVRNCSYSSILYHLRVFLTLNNIVTLKSGLEVTQGHWKWCHPKRLDAVSYLPSIDNYGDILYRLLDITTLVENREIFIPHLYLAPPQGGDSVGISWRCLMLVKQSDWATVWWKNYDDMLSRFHTIPACHGPTDGRTDGQNCYINILTRDKNQQFDLSTLTYSLAVLCNHKS